MPQREELDLAIKFAETPGLEKLLSLLKQVKGVRDDLVGKPLVPVVEQTVIDTFAKINTEAKRLIDLLRGATTLDTITSLNKDSQELLATEQKLTKVTTDFVNALLQENKTLEQVDATMAAIRGQKSQLDKQINQLIKSGNTESATFKELTDNAARLNASLIILGAEKKRLTGTTEKELGAYQLLNEEYKESFRQSQNLLAQNRKLTDSEQAVIDKTIALDTRLKEIDSKLGRNTRNVGNYASGFNGLQNSINQVTREAPAFVSSLQAGFSGIANNLPIVADEIKRLIDTNKELISQGKPIQSVFSQVAGAVFSVGTALSAGITLLTLFGPKIIESFVGTSDAIRKAEEELKAFNDQQVIALNLALSNGKITQAEFDKAIGKIDEFEAKRVSIVERADQEILNAQEDLRKDLQKTIDERINAEKKISQAQAERTRENIAGRNFENSTRLLKEGTEALQKAQEDNARVFEVGTQKIKNIQQKADADLIELEKERNKKKKENRDKEFEEALRQFELESKIQIDFFNNRKVAVQNDLKNDELSFDEKQKRVTELKTLNETTADNIEAIARRVFKNISDIDLSKIDFQKLSLSPSLTKDLQAISKRIQLLDSLRQKTEQYGDSAEAETEQERKLTEERIKLNKELDVSLQTLQANQIQIERERAIAVENIRAQEEKKATERRYKGLNEDKKVKELLELQERNHVANIERINRDAIARDISRVEKQLQLKEATEINAEKKRVFSLRSLNDRIEKIQRESTQKQINIKKFEIQSITDTTEEANARRLKAEIELEQLISKQLDEERQRRQKNIDEAVSGINSFLGGLQDALNRKSVAINDQLATQARNISQQSELAARGLENTLAFEEGKRAELERKQEETRRNAEKAAKLQSFFNLVAEYAKDNPNTAAAKALIQVEIADAIAARLEHGTEGNLYDEISRQGKGGGVASNGISYGRTHGQGGILVEMEGEEGMFGKREMRNLGKGNFSALKKLARTGPLADDYFARENEQLQTLIISKPAADNSKEIIDRLNSIEKAITAKPVSNFSFNKLGEFVEEEISSGMKKTTIHKRSKRIGG